jgi:hypothetical protein
LGLGFGDSGFGDGGSSMAAGLRGRSGGGCRTGGGGGVWAERQAAVASPAGVVEEAGWAKVGSGGGVGEKPAAGSSVEADPAAASSWEADPAVEASPEPGRVGSAAGTSKGSG